MAGSQALARGDFQHRVVVSGNDELAQLGAVSNETARTLESLYENLRSREERLHESEKELRNSSNWCLPTCCIASRWNRPVCKPRRARLLRKDLEEWGVEGFRKKVVHSEDLERYLGDFETGFKSGQPFETEARILGKDGRYAGFSAASTHADERGQIFAMVCGANGH